MANSNLDAVVTAAVGLPDGSHTGKITKVERDQSKFDYLRLHIQVDGTDGLTLKSDYPFKVSDKSALGKVVEAFTGSALKVGAKVNFGELFEGKRVKFTTITEETDRGTFARIVNKSVRPA